MNLFAVQSLPELLQLVAKEKLNFTLRVDSRLVEPGDVFLALPPVHGHEDKSEEHLLDALEHGAALLFTEQPISERLQEAAYSIRPREREPRIVLVNNARRAMGELARACYRTHDISFPLIGITGTNGKTTSAYLLEYFLQSQQKRVGVLGTITYRWPRHSEDAPLTTPFCLTLHEAMAAMQKEKVHFAVLEVSSHALEQERVAGLDFSVALFTNLTQDHLDYHENMESYYEAKTLLFKQQSLPNKWNIINHDDAYGRRLLAELQAMGKTRLIAFGLNSSPEQVESLRASASRSLHGELLSNSPDGLHMVVHYVSPDVPDRIWHVRSPMVGQHNASNLLGVIATALALSFTPSSFGCFEEFHGVPGRLERINTREGVSVFVDYAHTPDALTNALRALRSAGFERIVTLFGCGGDRDRSKRPLMAQAVADFSDVVVLTSDNPRTENPEAILDDIEPGFATASKKPELHREVDRRKALMLALDLCQPNNALLVAGKGHESYQILGTVKHPFSDQSIIRELVSCK